ncbi:hypothetical protein MASR2M79_23480 [Aminivibrio sp.]
MQAPAAFLKGRGEGTVKMGGMEEPSPGGADIHAQAALLLLDGEIHRPFRNIPLSVLEGVIDPFVQGNKEGQAIRSSAALLAEPQKGLPVGDEFLNGPKPNIPEFIVRIHGSTSDEISGS